MEEKKTSLGLPIAIVVAGALIAGAIYFVNVSRPTTGTPADTTPKNIVIPAISADDHILGNPDAKVIIVEYSDLECPFCKQFHATMHTLMDEFGKDGRVAWVYRHFPLPSLHPKAPKEAEATECVAELGGNVKFWQYIDKIYEVTPSNNGLDLALLPKIAGDIGIDKVAFQTCLDSGRYTKKVEGQFNDAVTAGGQGTPYSVVIAGGEKVPVEGAYPLATMRAIVNTALGEEVQ